MSFKYKFLPISRGILRYKNAFIKGTYIIWYQISTYVLHPIAIPVQALKGSRRMRIPYFKTISMKAVRMSALRNSQHYPPGNPCYSFLLEDESTLGP